MRGRAPMSEESEKIEKKEVVTDKLSANLPAVPKSAAIAPRKTMTIAMTQYGTMLSTRRFLTDGLRSMTVVAESLCICVPPPHCLKVQNPSGMYSKALPASCTRYMRLNVPPPT